jgi:hypothetical protein
MQEKNIIEFIIKSYNSDLFYDRIEDLADCPEDNESFEECSNFINKRWVDVDYSDWIHHHYAISFFTKKARELFWPSVMLNMLSHPQQISIALDSYMYHFWINENDDLSSLIGDSQAKFECFKLWCKFVRSSNPEFTRSLCVDGNRIEDCL